MKTKKNTLRVTVDAHEFNLCEGDRVIGHYTSVEGLLGGALRHLSRSRLKGDHDLSEFCTVAVGIFREAKAELSKLAFIAEKRVAAGPQKFPLAESIRARINPPARTEPPAEDMVP